MTDAKPAWQRINELFERFGLPHPPTRLRDELVMFNANTEPLATARAAGDGEPKPATYSHLPSFWCLEHPNGSWIKTGGLLIGGSLDPQGVTFTRDIHEARQFPNEETARSWQMHKVCDPVYRELKRTEHALVSPRLVTPAEAEADLPSKLKGVGTYAVQVAKQACDDGFAAGLASAAPSPPDAT